MLRSAAKLKGFAVQAMDGEMGKVDELYFDENGWVVRYLVVDLGGWLIDRRVLVVPDAVERIDVEAQQVSVTLTKEQVESSPSILMDEPISREKERELHEYYHWQPYWSGYSVRPSTAATFPPSFMAAAQARRSKTTSIKGDETQLMESAEKDDASVLRSTAEVKGYHVQGSDGDVGQVADFIFDDEAWTIRHLVVDAGGWLASREVLIAPPWIERITWKERTVSIALTQESIRQSPVYDPALLDLSDYEKKLLEHYASWFSRLLAREQEAYMHLGKDIVGNPVITIDSGRSIGEVKDVYLDTEGQSVVAIYLGTDGLFSRERFLVESQEVVTIGPDAVLVNDPDAIRKEDDIKDIQNSLRRDDLQGRLVETPGETKVGAIGDVVMDKNGRVLGFSLGRVFVSGPVADNRSIAIHAVRDMGNEDGIMTIDLRQAENQTLSVQ